MNPSSLKISTPTWISRLLQNPEITDILLNGTLQAYFDQGQGLEAIPIPENEKMSSLQTKDWILSILSSVGKSWDAKYPFVDASLPSGHRLHVVFPPLSLEGILISIRRLSVHRLGSEKGEFSRWKESALYSKAREAIQKGDSILISGSTGSGKTTLASDLLSEVSPLERVIALEDTPELFPHHPHFIRLISRPPNADGHGEITLRTLLKQTLRMRPDRIILGECRGAEVLDLLQALNTGHRGALATLHANSPRDALRRVELLCLLGSRGTLPVPVIRELLCIGIQWVVQVKRSGPKRKISEIWRIEGREGDTILMRPVLI